MNRYIALYVCMLIVIPFAFVLSGEWRTAYGLEQHAVRAEAVIRDRSCEEKASVTYVFVVAGTQYTGEASTHDRTLCSRLSRDPLISIRYVPEDPSLNSASERDEMPGLEICLVLAVVIFPPFVVASVILGSKRLKRRAQLEAAMIRPSPAPWPEQ